MEPPNKDVSFKYGVPKNTISTWKKNKSNFFEAFNNGSCFKKQRMKPETYEALNKALLKWLLLMRSNNIPTNVVILNAKACDYARELQTEGFHASDGCLEKWKNGK